jgi:hypothetical protein
VSDPKTSDLKSSDFDTWARIEKRRAEEAVVVVKVDDRAAVRQKIIAEVRGKGRSFVVRSEWKASEARASGLSEDWSYSGVALHHAGNSYTCNANGADSMRRIQQEHFKRGSSDIGYHYGIDCSGTIYEGRDVRFLGAHIGQVPGVLGVVLLSDASVRGEQQKVEKELPWWRKSNFGVLPTSDDLDVSHDELTESQVESLEVLTKVLLANFTGIKRFGGHREWAKLGGDARACPGAHGLIVARMVRTKISLEAP